MEWKFKTEHEHWTFTNKSKWPALVCTIQQHSHSTLVILLCSLWNLSWFSKYVFIIMLEGTHTYTIWKQWNVCNCNINLKTLYLQNTYNNLLHSTRVYAVRTGYKISLTGQCIHISNVHLLNTMFIICINGEIDPMTIKCHA